MSQQLALKWEGLVSVLEFLTVSCRRLLTLLDAQGVCQSCQGSVRAALTLGWC